MQTSNAVPKKVPDKVTKAQTLLHRVHMLNIVEFMKYLDQRRNANTGNVSAVSGKNIAPSTLDQDRTTLLVVQLACYQNFQGGGRMAVCHMFVCPRYVAGDDDLLPPDGPGSLRSS